MFGPNASGWLALHRQQHAQLIAEAAVTTRVSRPETAFTIRVSAPRAPRAASNAPATAPACAPC